MFTFFTAVAKFVGGLLVKAGVEAATAKIASYIITTALYTAVTSYSINALQKKQQEELEKLLASQAAASAAKKGYGTNVNAVSPAASHAVIYGETRVGGVVFYRSTTNNQQYLHSLIALAGHEVEEIVTVFAGETALTINSDGFVTNDQFTVKNDSGGVSYYPIRIKKHLGADDQTADADLVAEDSAWTTNHRARGVAYIYVRTEFERDIFPTGLPIFSAIVKGKKVYDPRSGATAWSNNAALCLRDYLISDYGLGSETNEINDTVFFSAANVCDEDVSLSAGGTEKRYTIDGSFLTSANPETVITEFVASMAGSFWYSEGLWHVKAGSYTSSVLSLDEDDLRSNLDITTRHSRRDNFNTVTGTFSGPATDYQPTDYPQVTSSIFVAVDNNEVISQDISLPFTDTHTMAQRIAKIALFRTREQITLSGRFGSRALQLQVGDVISLTNTRLGFSSKTFEVVDWNFSFGSDVTLEVQMSLREISSAVFDWNAEESTFEISNTTLPSVFTTGTAGLTIGADLRVVNQAALGVLIVDVSSDQPYAQEFEIQYKRTGSSEWISAGRQSSNRFEIVGLNDDVYDVRARTYNTFGVKSDWATTENFSLAASTGAPTAVTNFTGNVVGSQMILNWTPSIDPDLSHYKVRYSQQTSGATYANSVDLVNKIARPANNVMVPAQSGTYFLKAVDKLGNVSGTASEFVVFVDPNNVNNFNAIQTIIEHPTFAGTRDDTVVLVDTESQYLALDTVLQFDSTTGNFDDQLGLFDGGQGTIEDEGLYYFYNSVDLGEKYTSRVYPIFKVDFLDYVNDFDSASGNFDDRAGDFDGDPNQFDVTSANLQLRHTDDDPSGSPSWSNWQDFIVADISARAMEFRVKMSCSNGAASPAVRELGARIDMPERTVSENDINFTGLKNVTFPTSFKGVPALSVALANLADGERYVISNKTRSGFTIEIFNGINQSTSAVQLDYVAKGFGKELT